MKLTKELLHDLLETAMCGCNFLEIKTLKSEKHLDAQFSEDYLTYRYYYEKCADRLLAGGHIVCYDYEDEDEKGKPKRYELQLSDFEKRIHEAPFSDDLLAVESFCNWRVGNYDYYACNNLLQFVLFGKVVYG